MTSSLATLITGASSGIGFELAKLFAQEGRALVLTARRQDKLEALAQDLRETYKVPVEVIALDLEMEGAAEKLFSLLGGKGISADVLINNAGFGRIGTFVDHNPQSLEAMIHLNIRALTTLSRLALPGMMARGSGGILNVASMAAFFPGPGFAVYYATKAYVLSLSEALHEECRGRGVVVSALCPGPVDTEFWSRAGEKPAFMQKLAKTMRAEDVAVIAYRGFKRGEAVITPSWSDRIAVMGSGFMPRVLKRRLMGKLQMSEDMS
jgi:uncharacterized protein